MKKITISFILIFLITFVTLFNQSCTNLHEEVYSDLTGELFFSNPDNLIFAFGVAYTNLYTLVGHKFGMVGIDAGTDLLVVPQRGGDWFDGGEWHRLHRHTWTPNETYVERWWNVVYYGINTCNRLILQFEQLEGVDTGPALAELRALRALHYYWLVDLYGNVPIIDRFDVPADYKPAKNTRLEVFNFIETELLDVMGLLSKTTGASFYGRVNYYVAQMILAKLYLNAEVYSGTARWADAMTAVDTIILSNNFALEGDYFANFMPDATNSPEHILGVHFDQVNAAQFEIHLFTLHYNLATKYGFEDNTWNGICAQEDFFNLFDSTDARLGGLLHGFQYDNEGNPIEDPSYEKFPANPFDPDGAPLNLTPKVTMLEPNCLRQAGARIAKFPFIEGSDRYTSNDFPIYRYADVLLMKAELLLRTGGSTGEALGLVNEVRARAGADPLPELTLEILLQERARELYAEGHRRSDQIRFGAYKNTRWEKPDVSADHIIIWPIPQSQINANPNLLQNDNY